MENLQKFYINGKWVKPNSTKTMAVLNPATEDLIGEIILGNSEDVDMAVSAAKNAFSSFSKTSKNSSMWGSDISLLLNIQHLCLV